MRDEGFAAFRALADTAVPVPVPVLRRSAAALITRAEKAGGTLHAAQRDHAAWLRRHADAGAQVRILRGRLADLRVELGDPHARERDLLARFDGEEAADVIGPSANAEALLAQADVALHTAAALTDDPTRSALEDLASAERSLRDAEREIGLADRAYEEIRHAAAAVPSELASLRELLRSGLTLRAGIPADATKAISAALAEAHADIDALEADAHRRPTATITALTRIRDRVDLALGDARSARARLDGAKAALPGALATARIHLGRAEAALQSSPSAPAQIRVAAAREELALARSAGDVVEALDAARRAIRHAEDAGALVAYARTHQP